MSLHEPPQEALIYEGNYNSPFRLPGSPLQVVFTDVAGSSQKYRVIAKGYSTIGAEESMSPQRMADDAAAAILDAHLQDDPDINAVASAIHDIYQEEYREEFKNSNSAAFNDLPVIITIHKPGKFKSANDILASLDQDERDRYQQDNEILIPQAT